MVTTNNIILTKESTQVTIGTKGVKENWTKRLSLVTVAKGTGQQDIDEGANPTKIVDLLLKAEKRYTIVGTIVTGLGTSDTNSDVADKRDDLRSIFFAGGVAVMNYEGTNFNVNFEKCEIDWRADDKDTVDEYDVQFTALVGEDFV